MSKSEAFIRVFQIPPILESDLELIVTRQEIDLVLGVDKRPLTGATRNFRKIICC